MMNKTFKSLSAVSFTVLGLLVGISLTGYTMAQEGDSVLVQKIDTLVDALADIASNNRQQEVNSNESIELAQASGVVNPMCLDNYLSWPSSSVFNANAPWSTANLYADNYATGITNQLTDLNGDGLTDYIYNRIVTTSYGVNRSNTCVLLNNGNGWDVVYQCVASGGSTGAIYYGDCAQL